MYIHKYPPTPALAKAGAAPGTTAGVELFFFPNALHFPRATQAIALSVHRPGATQATAISVHFPRALMQQSRFLRRSQTQQAAADPVQLQQVPEAVAMSFYGGSRLPIARLQNSPKLPKRFPAAPRRHSGRREPFLQLQQVPEAVAVSF